MRISKLFTAAFIFVLLAATARAGLVDPTCTVDSLIHMTAGRVGVLPTWLQPVQETPQQQSYPHRTPEDFLKIAQERWAYIDANMPEALRELIPDNIPKSNADPAYRDWYYSNFNNFHVALDQKLGPLESLRWQPGFLTLDGSFLVIIPEPSTIMLLLIGISVAGLFRVWRCPAARETR